MVDIPVNLENVGLMADEAKISTADICDALGRATIAARLKVRVTAVSNAVTEGRFPARWFLVVTELCEENGLKCPEQLFTFVRAECSSSTSNQEILHDQSSDDCTDAA